MYYIDPIPYMALENHGPFPKDPAAASTGNRSFRSLADRWPDLGLSEVEFASKTMVWLRFYETHGSLNVPIEHHPTIRYIIYNGYYKVMSNIPKMGQLPTPETSPRYSEWLHGTKKRGFENWQVRSYPRFHQKTRGSTNYDRHQLSITRKSSSLPSPPCGDAKTNPSRSCQVGSSVNSRNLPFSLKKIETITKLSGFKVMTFKFIRLQTIQN